MSTTEVIILIAAIVIVLALVAWAVSRSNADRRLARQREKRDEIRSEEHGHRVAAHRAQSDADAKAAEANEARAAAEEQAEIARQRQEEARQQAVVAEKRRDLAAERAQEADEIDPDAGREGELSEGAPRARTSDARTDVNDPAVRADDRQRSL